MSARLLLRRSSMHGIHTPSRKRPPAGRRGIFGAARLSALLTGLLCALFASPFAWSAGPQVYQVSPQGSDSARGDAEHPLLTLREAVERVQPGDTIELR